MAAPSQLWSAELLSLKSSRKKPFLHCCLSRNFRAALPASALAFINPVAANDWPIVLAKSPLVETSETRPLPAG